MLLKLIRYYMGYVRIKVCGNFTERFINICMARGIIVWDIKKPDENTLCLCMSKNDFKTIRSIAKKAHVHVSIIKKSGAFVKYKKHKKRKLFFAGLCVFLCFIFIMSQFIWQIEVNGLTYTNKQQFLATLREEGVYIGAPKWKIDQLSVKNRVLLKEKELSWVWVDLKGTKAVVNVSQLRRPPVVTDFTLPYDIVAEKDGIISSVIATSGTAKVKEGDSVLAGQLLISSVITSEYIQPRYTRASGEVFARTWYTEEDTFSTEIYPLTETGKEKNYRSLSVFGMNINMFFKKNPKFETFIEENTEKPLKLFGHDMGICLKSTTYKQTTPQKQTMTEEELFKYAENELFKRITPKLSENNSQTAKNLSHTKNDDGTYTITLTAEFVEQIGREEPVSNPIEMPDIQNSVQENQ